MSRKTALLVVAFASLALTAGASARGVSTNVGKGLILHVADGVGKSSATKNLRFRNAQVYDCQQRAEALHCEIRLDFNDGYCTGLSGSVTYSNGSYDVHLGGKPTCTKYPAKTNPRPTPAKPSSGNSEGWNYASWDRQCVASNYPGDTVTVPECECEAPTATADGISYSQFAKMVDDWNPLDGPPPTLLAEVEQQCGYGD